MQSRIGFLDRNILWGILVIFLTFATAVLIPHVGSLFVVLAPLPIIFFFGRLGRLKGWIVFGVSLALFETLIRSVQPGGDAGIFLLLGLMGVVIYENLRRNLTIEKTVLYSVLAGAGLSLVMIAAQSVQHHVLPWTLVAAYISRSIQESIDLSVQMGAQAEQVRFIKENVGLITRSILYIFPALILVGISFVTCLNIFFGRVLFLIKGLEYPDFGELTKWKAPESTVWALIVSGAVVLIPPLIDLRIVEIVAAGLNIAIVCLFLYFLQGLAVFEYYFQTRNIPRFLRLIFYALLVIQQYLIIIVVAVGLFDLWFDFRKLNPRPAEPEA